jgi:hypothetical protein
LIRTGGDASAALGFSFGHAVTAGDGRNRSVRPCLAGRTATENFHTGVSRPSTLRESMLCLPVKSRSADTTLSVASSARKCPQSSNSCSDVMHDAGMRPVTRPRARACGSRGRAR